MVTSFTDNWCGWVSCSWVRKSKKTLQNCCEDYTKLRCFPRLCGYKWGRTGFDFTLTRLRGYEGNSGCNSKRWLSTLKIHMGFLCDLPSLMVSTHPTKSNNVNLPWFLSVKQCQFVSPRKHGPCFINNLFLRNTVCILEGHKGLIFHPDIRATISIQPGL